MSRWGRPGADVNGVVFLFAAVGLIALATLGGVLWAHRRETRRRWARYQPVRGEGEPPSVVCPHCRRRWYSARVIRDRVCPACQRPF